MLLKGTKNKYNGVSYLIFITYSKKNFMNKLTIFLILFCAVCVSYAQQPTNTLAKLHQPYQAAMGMLYQAQGALPQDSVLFAREWQQLKGDYKLVSDSLKQIDSTAAPIHFEAQRIMQLIGFAKQGDSLQHYLNKLYQYTAQHQEELVDDGAQLKKIAQCLMGIRNDTLRSERAISKYNAHIVSDFYKHLNTANWDRQTRHGFFGFFASQHASTGNIGMAETLYGQFDTLLVAPMPLPKATRVQLPDSLPFLNGFLKPTNTSWQYLSKSKIVIQPQAESLFDLVYLIRTLWAWDKTYQNNYSMVVLRNKEIITDEFLKVAKRNLAFSNYYIANYTSQNADVVADLPHFSIVNADGSIAFATNNPIAFFAHLNVPFTAQQAKYDQQYKDALKKQEQNRKKELALPIDISEKYSASHQHIQVSLKGYWQDSLSTRLTPVRWSKTDTLPNTALPYLAQLQVFSRASKYSRARKMYQCFVLVNGKKQNISLLADRAFNISVNYKRKKNARWQNILTTIDSTLMLESNYNFIIANYPFQASPLIKNLKQKQEELVAYKQDIFKGIKKRKQRSLLKKYAEEKKELIQ
ncbi:MAG: hypothetical protein GY699_02445 [Desulfobacteraceae bacterium]|nr:hypothetical protein [Desulfobacteraceae bacterium]